MLSRAKLSAALAGLLLVAVTGCSPTASIDQPAITAPTTDEHDLGPDDGFVPVGVWITLDDDVPAITNLDPDLRAALDAASLSAADRDVQFTFTNGWRSERYQQHLFDEAIVNYASEEEARRWVKPPSESQHVLGKAVDVATADAMDWLTRFGAEFGLCQTYANESWHFEHVPGVTETCPDQLIDGSAG